MGKHRPAPEKLPAQPRIDWSIEDERIKRSLRSALIEVLERIGVIVYGPPTVLGVDRVRSTIPVTIEAQIPLRQAEQLAPVFEPHPAIENRTGLCVICARRH